MKILHYFVFVALLPLSMYAMDKYTFNVYFKRPFSDYIHTIQISTGNSVLDAIRLLKEKIKQVEMVTFHGKSIYLASPDTLIIDSEHTQYPGSNPNDPITIKTRDDQKREIRGQ